MTTSPPLGLSDNRLDNMYTPVFPMYLFQGMHGTLHLGGCTTLVRQQLPIEQERLQPLPQYLRRFCCRWDGGADSLFFNETLC